MGEEVSLYVSAVRGPISLSSQLFPPRIHKRRNDMSVSNSRVFLATLALCVFASGAASAAGSLEEPASHSGYSIAVFIPGVVAGSPTYEMLVDGVNRAAEERDGVSVKVFEGGFSQETWLEGITSLAASGDYDLIVSSNSAMPELCVEVSQQHPVQKFLLLDAYLQGNPHIFTLRYNQMEQAYLLGYTGGLVTQSSLPGATPELKVGLITAQEYPVMNKVIRVGYEQGLRRANKEIALDFRVVGNWYDATKAGELAAGMFDAGVDVVLTIAGGANQGVLAEAQKQGKYVLWSDSNGYSLAPGTVLGSSVLHQDRAAYEKTLLAIDGILPYGSAEEKGVKEGFVEFVTDDLLYLEHVPADIRAQLDNVVEDLVSGRLVLAMP
jgi:riboflavin transport system substrate-binding protein